MDTITNTNASYISRQSIALVAIVAAAIGLAYTVSDLTGVDWHVSFRPAALALPSNPYAAVPSFFGPPWLLIPLWPLAILPPAAGRGLFFVLSLAVFLLAIRRLGASHLTAVVFLFSPPVVKCLLTANIDWMPIFGATLPPQIGLFLVSAKPQIGAVIAVFWLAEAWRKGRAREVIRVFAPVSIALLISIALYGPWPLRMTRVLDFADWNVSFWPESIPVGLVLIVAAVRQRNLRFALPAGPCLSPYVAFQSWSAAVAGLAQSPVEMVVAVVGLWIMVALP
jgi:hypothetical protein